ncbi:MAG: nitrite/sulfite reductase, partial [Sphingopyxis sp.]
VEAEWATLDAPSIDLPADEQARIAAHFMPLPLKKAPARDASIDARRRADNSFDRWVRLNVAPHRVPGHAIVNIQLKEPGKIPGDASAEQMEAVAELAERFAHDEIRVTYQQNLVLPNVAVRDLAAVYDRLIECGLATANTELITDIIACPGLDYCNLANARAIPIAQAIAKKFADPIKAEAIGQLRLNISGCINACGHHHAGNIGILGVDKKGTEHYQVTLGGSPKDDAEIGDIVGPSFTAQDLPGAVETIVETYLDRRLERSETFLAAYRRLGKAPFRVALYGADANRIPAEDLETTDG